MDALLIMVVSFIGYILMYQVYGRFIGKRYFSWPRVQRCPPWPWKTGWTMYPPKRR